MISNFGPKQSTIDHLHIVEKTWDKKDKYSWDELEEQLLDLVNSQANG